MYAAVSQKLLFSTAQTRDMVRTVTVQVYSSLFPFFSSFSVNMYFAVFFGLRN